MKREDDGGGPWLFGEGCLWMFVLTVALIATVAMSVWILVRLGELV